MAIMGSAISMPTGKRPGRNSNALSIFMGSEFSLLFVTVPSLANSRLSGHAIDGSSVRSPGSPTCANQSNTIGAAAQSRSAQLYASELHR
jgi:hypothetical protein